jgi:hypothetical protein
MCRINFLKNNYMKAPLEGGKAIRTHLGELENLLPEGWTLKLPSEIGDDCILTYPNGERYKINYCHTCATGHEEDF